MKLPLVFVLTLVLVQGSEGHDAWSAFVSAFSNIQDKTRDITNYINEKGFTIRTYLTGVKDKVRSYFKDGEKQRSLEMQQERIANRFRTYIAEAQANDNRIFDSMAPLHLKFNCSSDDPSVHMTTPQLIALHGYPAQSHTVTTEDGYILTVHRIPHRKINKALAANAVTRKTALLHHGLLGSSADWVIPGPKKGLAYLLSDAGYDVWLANVRGNTYSRAHVSLSTDSRAFWNFTFHEVAQHDLPAVIDYIMVAKGWDAKIDYIGHSMGTTVLFALLSTKPQYNKKLRAGFALAPVAYMAHVKSPISMLARYADDIETLFKLLGQNEFLPQNSVMRWLSKYACEINHYEEALCENSLFVLCGHDEDQFNRTLLPMILGHVPAGASTKTLVHYAQEIRNKGRFQMFDYGRKGNLIEYGVVEPPEYPLHRITLPIALLSSLNDWLANNTDVTNLYIGLPNAFTHYIVPLKEFNHIDFLWAIDAPQLVYKTLLELLQKGLKTTISDDIITNEIPSG